MLSRAVPALLLLLLSAEHARADGLSWGSPSKKGCSRCNFRTYTAKLNNIPSGQKWENYCPGSSQNRAPPFTVNGYTAAKAYSCHTGWTGIFGSFEVPDDDCSCYWDGDSGPNTFKDNGCQASGKHRYSAVLCETQFLPRHIWGNFDVDDGVSDASSVSPAGSQISLPGLVIPVYSANNLNSQYQIPSGSSSSPGFFSLPLSDPARTQPIIIATQSLTGCTFQIARDANSNILFAHIRPVDSSAPQPQPDWLSAVTTGEGLADMFDNARYQPSLEIGGFARNTNEQLSFWTFGANLGGYGIRDDNTPRTAQLTGIATADTIFIIIQVQGTNGYRYAIFDMANLQGPSGGSASSAGSSGLLPRSVPADPSITGCAAAWGTNTSVSEQFTYKRSLTSSATSPFVSDCWEALLNRWAPANGSCSIPAATQPLQTNGCAELANSGSCSITACGVPGQAVNCGDTQCAVQSLIQNSLTEDGQQTGGSWSMNIGGSVQVATISVQNATMDPAAPPPSSGMQLSPIHT
ncbi:hypothetical protein WJX84_009682 [Apatococcus fuscideae]|uniref:Uncharacterized protein n=1 Tax=Apatococcus fuscideae TaxID=2026836 RepID=A0AAW1SSB5_9CHLO